MNFFSGRETTDNTLDGGGASLFIEPLVYEEGPKQHRIMHPLTGSGGASKKWERGPNMYYYDVFP
jgi:hypothetical protein